MKHPDNRVEYDLWISSDNELAMGLLHDIADWAMKFNDSSTLMTPHYVLWYCVSCRAKGYNNT